MDRLNILKNKFSFSENRNTKKEEEFVNLSNVQNIGDNKFWDAYFASEKNKNISGRKEMTEKMPTF